MPIGHKQEAWRLARRRTCDVPDAEMERRADDVEFGFQRWLDGLARWLAEEIFAWIFLWYIAVTHAVRRCILVLGKLERLVAGVFRQYAVVGQCTIGRNDNSLCRRVGGNVHYAAFFVSALHLAGSDVVEQEKLVRFGIAGVVRPVFHCVEHQA